MQYVCGLFGPKRPLMAIAFSSDAREARFYPMFMSKTGLSISDAFENQQTVLEILTNQRTICSDYKGWLRTTDLDYTREYQVWDCGIQIAKIPENLKQCKTMLAKILKDIVDTKPQDWQMVQARAQQVYQYLEDRGLISDHKIQHPEYGVTYSGRSKSLGFNIQGADDSHYIRSIEEDDNYFVHFDWVAADLRVLSLLSEDPVLNESFKNSDPYTVMAQRLNVSRKEGKQKIFQSLYSLDAEGLEEVFPHLATWIKHEVIKIGNLGYGKSILNRKFKLEDGRTNKSIFNAKMQGSVAHAMQNVLFQVFQIYPTKILTEVHDSLILTCKKEEIKDIIAKVSQIMLNPFHGILDSDPRFPIKISVGKSWRKWKLYKECR